jgi:NADPH-dependent glutamate synthase beta subunit-like oxidoreductase
MSAQSRRVPMASLPAEEAVASFAEVALGYTPEEARAEARRAAGLDLSGAQAACPFGVDAGRLAEAVAAGDFDRARQVVLEAHPWPGILGRHCQRYCERAQALPDGWEPIAISALERAAADHSQARTVFQPGASNGRRVAVVGAGSAASAAAYRLRQLGCAVTMLEQLPRGGGMMFAGYPEFRLPDRILRDECSPEAWGVETRYGVRVDGALLEELLREYHAVLLATGKFREAPMGIPGEDLDGAWDALSFLTQVKLGRPTEIGARVVVTGAGHTAQDVARTCRRLGAEVSILYRRGEDDMPIRPFRRQSVLATQQAEGAPYRFHVDVVRVLGQGGRVAGVECVRTEPGPTDASGRPAPRRIEGSTFTLPCDTFVAATGELPDLSFLPPGVRRDGEHVWVDEQWMTSLPGLFAAGEMTGLKGTDAAFAAGLEAAESIYRFLGGTVAPRRRPVREAQAAALARNQ